MLVLLRPRPSTIKHAVGYSEVKMKAPSILYPGKCGRSEDNYDFYFYDLRLMIWAGNLTTTKRSTSSTRGGSMLFITNLFKGFYIFIFKKIL